MELPSGRRAGFSLVEVVLAIGIATFVLVGILSLCTVALNTGKGATDDTLTSAMSGSLLNDFRRQDFTNIQNTLAAGTISTFFDNQGNRLQDASGSDLGRAAALASNALYQCDTMASADQNTLSSDNSTNLMRLVMKFTWPIQAAKPPNTNIIHAAVARY